MVRTLGHLQAEVPTFIGLANAFSQPTSYNICISNDSDADEVSYSPRDQENVTAIE